MLFSFVINPIAPGSFPPWPGSMTMFLTSRDPAGAFFRTIGFSVEAFAAEELEDASEEEIFSTATGTLSRKICALVSRMYFLEKAFSKI
jgi:hypothetical protein